MNFKQYRLTIKTTRQVVEALDALVRTGLYGRTRDDAAERLIARGIFELRHPITTTRPKTRARR